MKPLRVLNIEDSNRDHELIRRHLANAGYALTVERVDTAPDMEAALTNGEWDVILCDYSMPTFNAGAALDLLKRKMVDTPFIVVSGTVGEEEAVKALKAGADDYLIKDNLARLVPAIEREMQEAENRRARQRAENAQERLDAELSRERGRVSDIVGTIPGVVWEMVCVESESMPRLDYVSEFAESLLGYPLQDWLGEPEFWFSSIHEEDRDRVRTVAEEAIEKKRGWRTEFRWVASNGQPVWVDSQSVIVKDRAGKMAGFRGVCFDISERKKAEIATLDSEMRFRSLFESNPLPLWVYDVETLRFQKVNEAAVSHYGYSRDEFMSMTIKEIRSPEQVAPFIEDIEVRQQSNGYSGVWQHRKKDGTLIDVEISAHDLWFPDRNSRLVLANDITERLRAEHELSRSEERYRDLVENAHDIIFSLEPGGRFLSVNRAGELITGFSRDEMVRMNLMQTIAPDHAGKASEMIAETLSGREAPAYELDLMTKSGHTVSVEVNTKLVKQDGTAVRIQGIARDITARRRLEEQLLQAQKLESIGRLAGGIAHDFNNMLTAINGYSDLTLRQLPEDNPLRKNILNIKTAGERSAMLTNQLLAFSRQQVLHPEVVKPNEIIAETAQMLERVIGEDISLEIELNPNIGRVKVDPGQLSQIIMNLAVNARDAMPTGGRLGIETENIFLDPDSAQGFTDLRPGPYVRIAVADTGTGISDADLARIFEPFFTTKEVGRGTGLGLATVYGIVRQSGGSIDVKSTVGSGTTFTVHLPRLTEQIPLSFKTETPHAVAIGGETILLVEDEEIVRSLLKSLLEACGYKVIEAASGAAALSVCDAGETIDLMMTDLVMPKMSGRELAEKIVRKLPGLPVIFTSGYTDDTILRDGATNDEVHFIQKPFTFEAVSAKVRELLDLSSRP